ncbi:MAG: hypothetical protein Q8936_14260 [Bacillota bacterium]|nr:hypothetical protein [Bacillota bacterium]
MAGVKISNLPAGGVPGDSDIFPMDQSAVTKKVTKLQMFTLPNIPTTSSSTVGVIQQNGSRFIHTFNGNNTFVGIDSGNFTLTGFRNTGIGNTVLNDLTSGSDNTVAGWTSSSLTSGSNNTFFGSAISGVTTGSFNTCYGFAAGSAYTSSESSNLIIGSNGVNGESNVGRIGDTGTGSGQITDLYLAGNVHSGTKFIFPFETIVWVNGQTGSDTTGTGSAVYPYATITKANSVILDNATGKRYVIRHTGSSTEASLTIKPWTSIVGESPQTSQITITGTFSLSPDITWDGLANGVASISNVSFVGGASIDFDLGAFTGSAANLYLTNIVVGSIFCQGRAAGLDFVRLNNVTGADIATQDFSGFSRESSYSAASQLKQSISAVALSWESHGDTFINTLDIVSSTDDMTTSFFNSSILGVVTVTGVNSLFTYDAMSYPQSGITLVSSGSSNGISIQSIDIGFDVPGTGAFTTLSATGLITATAAGIKSWTPIGANTYTNATYIFALTDQDTYIRFDRATAQTITIDTNANVPFPIGTEINGIQAGAGQVTFAFAGGVTVNAKGGVLSVSGQFGGWSLKKYGSDAWDLIVG